MGFLHPVRRGGIPLIMTGDAVATWRAAGSRLVNIKPACSAIVSLQLHHLCNSGWSKIRGVTKKTLLFRRLLKFSTFSLEKELNSFRPLRAPERKSCRERTSIFLPKGWLAIATLKPTFTFLVGILPYSILLLGKKSKTWF